MEVAPLLAQLSAEGVIDSIEPDDPTESKRWVITSTGVQRLVQMNSLASPTEVSRARPGIPLKDKTSEELMIALRDEQWTHAYRRGPVVPYNAVDGNRTWYTTAKQANLSRNYLLALFQFDQLKAAGVIEDIEHGRTESYYLDILKIMKPKSKMLALPAPAMMEGIEDDMDIREIPRFDDHGSGNDDAIEDMPEAHSDSDIAASDGFPERTPSPLIGGDETPFGPDFGASAPETPLADPAPETPFTGSSPSRFGTPVVTPVSSASPLSSSSPVPSEPPVESDLLLLPPRVPVPPSVVSSAARSDRTARAIDERTLNPWHAFRISRTKRKQNARFGTWSAQCWFHKTSKDGHWDCTKAVSVLGPSARDEETALELVKYWCVIAMDYNRKSHHQAEQPHEQALPPPELVEALCPHERPDPLEILSDECRDKLELTETGNILNVAGKFELARDRTPLEFPDGGVDDGPAVGLSRGRGRGGRGRSGRGRGRCSRVTSESDSSESEPDAESARDSSSNNSSTDSSNSSTTD